MYCVVYFLMRLHKFQAYLFVTNNGCNQSLNLLSFHFEISPELQHKKVLKVGRKFEPNQKHHLMLLGAVVSLERSRRATPAGCIVARTGMHKRHKFPRISRCSLLLCCSTIVFGLKPFRGQSAWPSSHAKLIQSIICLILYLLCSKSYVFAIRGPVCVVTFSHVG